MIYQVRPWKKQKQILEDVAKIGAVGVPLNFRLGGEEIKYIVNHSDSEAFILGEAFVQTVKDIQKDLPQVRTYISVSEKPVEGMLHYESWIARYPDSEPLILVDEDDPALPCDGLGGAE